MGLISRVSSRTYRITFRFLELEKCKINTPSFGLSSGSSVSETTGPTPDNQMHFPLETTHLHLSHPSPMTKCPMDGTLIETSDEKLPLLKKLTRFSSLIMTQSIQFLAGDLNGL